MEERIDNILHDITAKHGYEFDEFDRMSMAMGVDILKSMGENSDEFIDTVITESALVIGLQTKYPDLPAHYAFLYRN